MFQWFKKYFIPNIGNDHQPHFLRSKNTRLIVVAILMLEFGVFVFPYIPTLNLSSNNYLAAVLPSVLDNLTNQNRQAQDLNVLTVSPALNKVAELKAEDMAQNGYFAHTSPDGKTPWYWFNLVGYKYEYAGENLAVDFTDSQDVAVAWINSSTHRANILKSTYTEVGTGVATGTYNGNSTVFVVQVFGKPATSTVAASVLFPQVLGASTDVNATPEVAVLKPTTVESYITSPRHILDVILMVLGTIVAAALILKLFVRMDKKHPALITNGLIVIALIFGIYVTNNIIAQNKMSVTTSFAGFHGDRFDPSI